MEILLSIKVVKGRATVITGHGPKGTVVSDSYPSSLPLSEALEAFLSKPQFDEVN